MRDKFLAIENELNALYLERRDVVRGLLVGLLSRQHVLLIGPPGTAKSAMVEDLCGRLGGAYFRWLLSRTSTPEELFGPVSLRALEQDSYRRVTTGKLPEATVAFLDEIFKANSAVLNTMLSVLNERLFFNDGTPLQVPLEMAVGASNELPEDREELGALWDRFLLRYVVGYVRDPRSFQAMLLGQAYVTRTTLTLDEVHQAQAEVRQIDVRRIIPHLLQVRDELAKANIPVSDRRWKQSLDLIRAHAWLEGRQEATADDLAILAPALWSDPSQIPQVRQLILSLANPLDAETQDLLDQALEVYQAAMQAAGDAEKATKAGQEANAKLRRMAQRLEGLQKEARAKGKSDARIAEALAQVVSWNKEVVQQCLGITI